MPQVQVLGGRVEPELDPERPALGEALLERPVRAHFDRIAAQELRWGIHPAQC
jgi:hypothetical protein